MLKWCQSVTREYPNVKIENLGESFRNGIAFCAILHHFHPDLFDYDKLSPQNKDDNIKLLNEKLGILNIEAYLEPEDFNLKRLELKSIFTQLKGMYEALAKKPAATGFFDGKRYPLYGQADVHTDEDMGTQIENLIAESEKQKLESERKAHLEKFEKERLERKSMEQVQAKKQKLEDAILETKEKQAADADERERYRTPDREILVIEAKENKKEYSKVAEQEQKIVEEEKVAEVNEQNENNKELEKYSVENEESGILQKGILIIEAKKDKNEDFVQVKHEQQEIIEEHKVAKIKERTENNKELERDSVENLESITSNKEILIMETEESKSEDSIKVKQVQQEMTDTQRIVEREEQIKNNKELVKELERETEEIVKTGWNNTNKVESADLIPRQIQRTIQKRRPLWSLQLQLAIFLLPLFIIFFYSLVFN